MRTLICCQRVQNDKMKSLESSLAVFLIFYDGNLFIYLKYSWHPILF